MAATGIERASDLVQYLSGPYTFDLAQSQQRVDCTADQEHMAMVGDVTLLRSTPAP